jgi:hypothetical protein
MPHILRTKHPLTLLLAACGGLLLISAIISSLSPSMSLVDLDSEGTTDSSTSILPSSSPFSTPHKPINNDGDELLNLLQSANALFRKKTLSAVQSSNAKDENAIINGVIMPKMGNTTVREEVCSICT